MLFSRFNLAAACPHVDESWHPLLTWLVQRAFTAGSVSLPLYMATNFHPSGRASASAARAGAPAASEAGIAGAFLIFQRMHE